MRFFIRSATIQIGANQYSMDNGFYFEFEIPFKDSEELQTVTFKVVRGYPEQYSERYPYYFECGV